MTVNQLFSRLHVLLWFGASLFIVTCSISAFVPAACSGACVSSMPVHNDTLGVLSLLSFCLVVGPHSLLSATRGW